MRKQNCDSFTLYRWNAPELAGLNCGCAAGLNFALHAPEGLSVSEIRENREKLSAELGVGTGSWICASQIHSSNSLIVNRDHQGHGALNAEDAISDTDALILTEPGINIMIFTADCLPLLLYDRRQAAAALIHAGWRGAAAGIVPSVLNRMINELDCRTEDIFAAAGSGHRKLLLPGRQAGV